MGNIFHFIIVVNYVDTCVDKGQVGAQLHVAGIEHVCQQGQIVAIPVVDDAVVLIGQFYTFLLCTQFGECRHEVDIVGLYGIFNLFLCQIMRFVCLSGSQSGLFQLFVVLEKRGNIIFDSNTKIPVVEIIVEGRHFNGDWTVQMFGGYDGHFR